MEFQLKNFRRELEISLLANIHYFEFESGYSTEPDMHDFCELVYVDSGEITVFSDNYTGPLKKNEMILHVSNEKHCLSCEKDTASNVIIIGFKSNCSRLKSLSTAPTALDETLRQLLADVIKEGRNIFLPPYDIPNLKNMPKRKNFEFGSDQLVQNLLECFFIYALRKTQKENKTSEPNGPHASETIRSIKEYVDNNFTKNLSIADLCYIFNTNKTTLCREFKALTGRTMTDYVNMLRIKHTKMLLREHRYTLTQIADILNLSSVHYLTTLFKKYEKLSPTEYVSTIKARYE